MAAKSNAINLQNVSKVYQMADFEVNALKNVSLTVKKGEYLAIMGSSGSGKSTMLNLLGCLDRPTNGCYLLGDEDVSQKDDDELSIIRNRHIGFVFQSFNLIPQLTVLENIEVPMFYRNSDPALAREKCLKLAQRVGLGDRTSHKPTELSGGQMQRVAMARALSNDPTVILADEPTGNLDSVTEAEILDLMDEVNKMGKTIVVVTHDDSVAERAHRIIFLKDGEIDREVFN